MRTCKKSNGHHQIIQKQTNDKTNIDALQKQTNNTNANSKQKNTHTRTHRNKTMNAYKTQLETDESLQNIIEKP